MVKRYAVETAKAPLPEKRQNFFERNFLWFLLYGLVFLLFIGADYGTPPEVRVKDDAARLEQTLVNIHSRCMRERFVEAGFDSLKRYCTWKMAQYIQATQVLEK